jgi:hypothetical protein
MGISSRIRFGAGAPRDRIASSVSTLRAATALPSSYRSSVDRRASGMRLLLGDVRCDLLLELEDQAVDFRAVSAAPPLEPIQDLFRSSVLRVGLLGRRACGLDAGDGGVKKLLLAGHVRSERHRDALDQAVAHGGIRDRLVPAEPSLHRAVVVGEEVRDVRRHLLAGPQRCRQPDRLGAIQVCY